MPTYDYTCADCGGRNSIYQPYVDYGKVSVVCRFCGGAELQRLIGSVRVTRSEESRHESLADPDAWGDYDESDPRSMAKMMRKMGDELGEELPQEFDEVVERLESGESPEEIEAHIPDSQFKDRL